MLSKHLLPRRRPVPLALHAIALAALLALVGSQAAFAQAPAAPVTAAAPITAQQLEQLVGRIALYPDDLVAVILPASTNPLQLVQADRFLDQRKSNPKLELPAQWDDPVKTLCNYPDIVKMMSNDLDWTTDLGEAVVADTGEVIEAVQAFRRRAQAAGHLKSDDKQKVAVEKEVITIVPADPQVIYVPQYEPSQVVVAGAPYPYGYWPTAYPSYYYPYAPGAALAAGIVWGAAIGAVWGGGHYHVDHHGGNNNINIDRSRNTNINSGNRNQATQWKSNKSPGQVSGATNRGTSAGNRAGDHSRVGAGGAGQNRAGPNTAAAGNRAAGGAGGAGGGAFDGMGSARQTQMDSSRGAASRGSDSIGGGGAGQRPSAGAGGAGASRPSAATRPSGGGGFSGGGGHRGGGGGGRGGGGGGRR